MIGTEEKHLTWLPRALIKAAGEEIKASQEAAEGHRLGPPTITPQLCFVQHTQGKGKSSVAMNRLLNVFACCIHHFSSFLLRTGTVSAVDGWGETLKTITQVFVSLAILHTHLSFVF